MIDIQTFRKPYYVYSYSKVPKGFSISSEVNPNKIGLKFVKTGQEDYQTNTGQFNLGPNQLLILDEHTGFSGGSFQDGGMAEGICIDLHKQLFSTGQLSLIRKLFLDVSLSIASSKLGQSLLQQNIHSSQAADHCVKQVFQDFQSLCKLIYTLEQNLQSEFKKQETIKRNTQTLWAAKEYLFQHYQQEFSLVKLARAVGLSPFQLARLFKSSFGITPLHYHHQVRLEQVVKQIKSNDNLTELAYDVGYESLSSFSKKFKQQFGLSPSLYKKAILDK